MEPKKAFLGVIIFAVVAVSAFLLFREVLKWSEGLSVVFGITAGIIAEVIYRRSRS